MQGVILAGGLGTRLRSLICDRPKPMAPAGGKPFMEYLITHMARQDLDEILICIGYMGQQIMDHFGFGEDFGVHIRYSWEDFPLGTAGALRNAASHLEETFILVNGDTYFPCPYAGLLEFHRSQKALATLAVQKKEYPAGYGEVVLDSTGRVTSFRESDSASAAWVNAGLYVMERKILEWVPDCGAYSLERELLPKMLAMGKLVSGYGFDPPISGEEEIFAGAEMELHPFTDIGIPERYRAFKESIEGGKEI
ncbi:MAG TPA: nucleotidyltransferase [Clostridiales bacterium]|nr:nucleotidyltransferase [Clostridiales bacterium]